MTTYQPPIKPLQHATRTVLPHAKSIAHFMNPSINTSGIIMEPLCSAVLHRSCSVLTYYLALSWVSNSDDDKLPCQRRCAGVDCCLPLDTQSNGFLYSMLTSCPICQHDKSVSYNTKHHTPITILTRPE